MFDNFFALLLLPACFVLGWALARRTGKLAPDAETLGADAIAGLTSLARDDTDEAIAALSRATQSAPGAVELRLTLGALFRRRGEIDRAIRLHETLLENQQLPAAQAARARLELAQDYLKAGVIDRAETLAQSLVDSGLHTGEALDLLLDLYEQTRDWPQAIAVAQRWQAVRGRSAAARIAQYHCEQAEAARGAGDLARARDGAQAALGVDRGCVRASILLGTIAEKQNSPGEALRHYARVLEQAPVYFPEVLPALRRCAEAARDEKAVAELFAEAEQLPEVPMPLLLAKAQWMASRGEAAAAASWLAARLAQKPDWEGLLLWLDLSGSVAVAGDSGQAMQASLRKRLAAQPRYTCAQCGLKPSVLMWQCPSCKNWGTVKPA